MGDITNEKITYTDREVKTLNNYIQNGLTYISDNTKIHPRDEAGNIIFNDGAVDNPILIVLTLALIMISRASRIFSGRRIARSASAWMDLQAVRASINEFIVDERVNRY